MERKNVCEKTLRSFARSMMGKRKEWFAKEISLAQCWTRGGRRGRSFGQKFEQEGDRKEGEKKGL